MIEHIESLLVPSVYNKIRKSTNDIWNHAKTLPVELSELVIESDGLYFKFEKTRRGGELQLLHTFIDTVMLKEGPIINRMIPDAEKKAITSVQLTINLPPNAATVYDLTQDNNGAVITWVENHVQYWRCKSKPVLNRDSGSLFFNYNKLTNVNEVLLILDTSNVEIMSSMFNNCTTLGVLDLSSFTTSSVITMNTMFGGCASLTDLNLSSFDTSKVESMHYAFGGCASLTSLDLSHFDTSKVNNMTNMFNECAKLITLNLSSFVTTNVKTMNGMFSGCASLTSLDLSHFDTSKVNTMRRMFTSCASLTSLDLSSFNTTKVTDMDSIFYYCAGLTSLNLSSFDTSNVKNMSSMFGACKSLFFLDLSSFDTTNVVSMEKMFYLCVINGLDISMFNTINVKNMRQMFYETPNVLNIEFGPNFVFTAMPNITISDSTNNTYQMMYHCTASGPWNDKGKFDLGGTFTLNTVTNLMDGPSINNSLNRTTATSFIRSTTPPDTGGV